MHSKPNLGIVADDLTGANDTLVQFAEAGFSARLSLSGPDTTNTTTASPAAVASVTDTRPLEFTEARFRTRGAVEQLALSGIDQLYVKIDSTMRGSIAGQVAGALDAWRRTHPDAFAVVCPAYPAMGRVVELGRLLVHGTPVEHTPAGSDPVTPVLSSSVTELLPNATLAPTLADVPEGERAPALLAAASQNPVVVVNAVEQSDLELLAAALLEIGPRAVPVGSAGLAGALAARWAAPATENPPSPDAGADRTLVVVSSLHDVSREQAMMLAEALPPEELLVLRPTMDNLRTAADTEGWLKATLPPHDVPRTVLVLSPSRVGAGLKDQPGGASTGAMVASGLAWLTAALMAQEEFSNLVLMGGDGARAVLRECGAESVTVLGALEEGVPLGVINGGRANGIRTVTKAGGFGTPQTLVDILKTLTHLNQHSTEASS